MHAKIMIRRMKAAKNATDQQSNQDDDTKTVHVKPWQYYLGLAMKEFRETHGQNYRTSQTLNFHSELVRQAKNQPDQCTQDQQHASISRNASSSTTSSRCIDSTSNTSSSKNSNKWDQHFQDLITFRQIHGHCLVPYQWKENIALSRWVKRQRYQYKLKKDGVYTTMTDTREACLKKLGFVWDAHAARWEENLNDLRIYKNVHGTCNVRSTCTFSPRLADWVKSQRRHYRNFVKGKESRLTQERIQKLDELGFNWNPHSLDLQV